MTLRKKKLRLIQALLLIAGCFVIFFTYAKKNDSEVEGIVSKETQKKIKQQISKNELENSDVFYNIEYTGIDLAGNRYILKSKEAYNTKTNQEVVNMKFVEAIFYFKNDTTLEVWSSKGTYNNKTLDMKFDGDVKAFYENSELYADKAEYSNSKSFLVITNNVRVKDTRGTMLADKLLFDIKKQKLNIASFKDSKINANMNLK